LVHDILVDTWLPDAQGATTDVYPVLGGGWRAACECGRTTSIDTEPAAWIWVIDHACAGGPEACDTELLRSGEA
jgi:hypothetical protein